MLARMILAATALAAASPAAAACLEDRVGAQCDVFLDEYLAQDVPTGTSMVSRSQSFLVENFSPPGFGDMGVDHPLGRNDLGSDNVYYWDGRTGYVVSSASGPQFKIADF